MTRSVASLRAARAWRASTCGRGDVLLRIIPDCSRLMRAFEGSESLSVEKFDVHRGGGAGASEPERDGADADRVLASGLVGEGVGVPVTQRKGCLLGTTAQCQPAAACLDPGGAVVAVGVCAGVAVCAE